MGKCLFVLRSAGIGGTATSLSNLLSFYNEKGYEFDVFLFTHDGEFAQRVKSVANLLPEEIILSSVTCTKQNLKKRVFLAKVIRVIYSVLHKIIGVKNTSKLVFKLSAMRLSGKYDTVVAFQEDATTDYVQYIKCKRRIAWCHSNFDTICTNPQKERQLKNRYSYFDNIVCVSNIIRDCFIKKMKLSPDKVTVIYNAIPQSFIKKQSTVKCDVSIQEKEFKFASMGRFAEVKRFDRVVMAAYELKKRNIDFVWYIIGDGNEFKKIKDMIDDEGLKNEVVLLGSKTNPFPCIKNMDCFVMSSTSEGQPMVLNEALVLGIPVITTDFASAREVVGNVKGAIIVPNSDEGLINGVLEFVYNEDLRNSMKACAKDFVYDNETILKKVSDIIKV